MDVLVQYQHDKCAEIAECFSRGMRRLHLFGRHEDIREGWVTMGLSMLETNFDCRKFTSMWDLKNSWLLPPDPESEFYRLIAGYERPVIHEICKALQLGRPLNDDLMWNKHSEDPCNVMENHIMKETSVLKVLSTSDLNFQQNLSPRKPTRLHPEKHVIIPGAQKSLSSRGGQIFPGPHMDKTAERNGSRGMTTPKKRRVIDFTGVFFGSLPVGDGSEVYLSPSKWRPAHGITPKPRKQGYALGTFRHCLGKHNPLRFSTSVEVADIFYGPGSSPRNCSGKTPIKLNKMSPGKQKSAPHATDMIRQGDPGSFNFGSPYRRMEKMAWNRGRRQFKYNAITPEAVENAELEMRLEAMQLGKSREEDIRSYQQKFLGDLHEYHNFRCRQKAREFGHRVLASSHLRPIASTFHVDQAVTQSNAIFSS
jgi:hypothetical protein